MTRISEFLCDYIIPFCDAVVLSVGTLQVTVWKGALFTGYLVSSKIGGDWLCGAEMEGTRDVFAKRAAAMTVVKLLAFQRARV